ncbi:hypothetical protein [Epilithonimonas sp.]|uniref:hypothetical protein n=1 Tax=Epilithonimonas sp. TaxID=2894511 RepID=UPI0035B074DD
MKQFETFKEMQQKFIQTKTKVKKLLDMCLEKELQFNINPSAQSISIYNINREGEFTFNYDSYYFGDLCHLNHGNTITLDELIKNVKAYKKY